MKKAILFFSLSFLLVVTLFSQEVTDHENYRLYSGEFNNQAHPSWGKTGDNLIRVTRIAYDDKISSPAGEFRPNPRTISNIIFSQEETIYDPDNLSDFCWVFGQFIDHDIGLTTDNHAEDASISVPLGDIYFDPFSTGNEKIHMARNISDPATGTSSANPRQHPNIITAFIDASNVYGSDPIRANWLRSFEGGKLRTSAGNLLPFNTLSGEFDGEIDPNAPDMANPTGISQKIFVAGDIRAGENVLLTTVHTLFMREHNRRCDLIAVDHPDWNDEQIYQHARKFIGGIIQSIVYEEWLPTMGIQLESYTGYKSDVNPQIMNLFSGAAYRLGHTLLSSEIQRYGPSGEVIPEGHLLLRNAYFNPFAILDFESIDIYFRGMAAHKEQKLDAKIVHDVRNFLFGEPGSGGLDLASINIQRGRERGLPDYNTIRTDLGLSHYSFFQAINDDPAVFNPLLLAYNGNINGIDPWPGILSEKPLPNSIFGETLTRVMELQFNALRDGDRFYYANDPVLSQEEINEIQNTSFRDVIMHNSSISIMQENVFQALPHDEICEGLFVALSGNIRNSIGDNVEDVTITVANNNQDYIDQSDATGNFTFEDIPGCGTQGINFVKEGNLLNGVSTLDLILIQKHILGLQLFTSAYQYLAADVDKSGSISTFDLLRLRQAILGINTDFPGNTSWRFVPANFVFEEPYLILNESWEVGNQFDGFLGVNFSQDYIAVKVGDVNNTATTTVSSDALLDRNTTSTLQLSIGSQELEEGNVYRTELLINYDQKALGYQFALSYDSELIEILEVEGENGFSSDFIKLNPSNLVLSWNSSSPKNLDNQIILSLLIKANSNLKLSEALQLNSRTFANQVYDEQLNIGSVSLAFNESINKDFHVAQNDPNPFVTTSLITYHLPSDGEVTRTLVDVSGREIYTITSLENEGQQTWTIERSKVPTAGIYFYKITYDNKVITKRFVVQ